MSRGLQEAKMLPMWLSVEENLPNRESSKPKFWSQNVDEVQATESEASAKAKEKGLQTWQTLAKVGS